MKLVCSQSELSSSLQLVSRAVAGRPTVPLQRLLQKPQRCGFVTFLRDIGFQNLALVIDRAPEVMHLTVYLHEHLFETPPPGARTHALDPAFPDLGREHRPEPMPPEPDRLVADLDASLAQKILDQKALFDMVLEFVLGSEGIPRMWFGSSGETNRASAVEQNSPIHRTLLALQKRLKDIITAPISGMPSGVAGRSPERASRKPYVESFGTSASASRSSPEIPSAVT